MIISTPSSRRSPSLAVPRRPHLTSAQYTPMEKHLPRGQWTLYNWQSIPRRTRRLVYSSKKDPLDKITTYTYLLKQDLFALGLQLYVYESNEHITLYISKADTSGYHRTNAGPVIAHMIGTVLRSLPPKKIRISLTAKSQGQYLFPNSVENPEKHVLDDAQLIKWWIKVLDLVVPLLRNPKGRLHIPGMPLHEVETYLPTSVWRPGDIYSEPDKWAVKCIPRFEDDPKTRFLNDIVQYKRAKVVQCEQFWLELADRQECNIQARLGIVGLEAEGVLEYEPLQMQAFGQKENDNLQNAVLSGSYATRSEAEAATELLEDHLPDGQELEGEWEPPAKVEAVAHDAPVNSLQGLVRKKRKVN